MRRISTMGSALAFSLHAVLGAQGAADVPRFEVASIRPNQSGDLNNGLSVQPGGRFIATNVTPELLIRRAYQLEPFQLIGGPDWLKTARFDIVATAGREVPEPTPFEIGPVQLMLQSLLVDRFGLVVRRELRQMPVYALVLARADGRLGPALQRSAVDCPALAAARARGGPPLPQPLPGGRPVCGMRSNNGRIAGGGVPLTQLAAALGGLGRGVLDRTGLPGAFNFELTFSPTGSNPSADGASIFTALQEQLGLRLEPTTGAVDVLVVQGAELPMPD